MEEKKTVWKYTIQQELNTVKVKKKIAQGKLGEKFIQAMDLNIRLSEALKASYNSMSNEDLIHNLERVALNVKIIAMIMDTRKPNKMEIQ